MAAVTNADVEVVDFDLDDDDLMDEDAGAEPSPAPALTSRLRSTIAGDDAPRRTKGRGFRDDPNSSSAPRDSRFGAGGRGDFDSLGSGGGPAPIRCTSPPPQSLSLSQDLVPMFSFEAIYLGR
jgi:RNA-binding protein 8A